MAKNRSRREFLKTIGAIGLGVGAGAVLSRIPSAQALIGIPSPVKVISPKHPMFIGDAYIYIDGSYAIARDRYGVEISKSTDHASVLNEAIWHVVEKEKRPPHIIVDGKLVLGSDIELPTLTDTDDYRYAVIIQGIGRDRTFVSRSSSILWLESGVKIRSKADYWSYIIFRDLGIIAEKGAYVTYNYVIPFFENVGVELRSAFIQQNITGPPGVQPVWRNMNIIFLVTDPSTQAKIDIHFEGFIAMSISTIMQSSLTDDSTLTNYCFLMRGASYVPYMFIGLDNFVSPGAEYVYQWVLFQMHYGHPYFYYNIFSNVQSTGFSKEPTIFVFSANSEDVVAEAYGVNFASYGHYLINWWGAKPKHFRALFHGLVQTKLSGTTSTKYGSIYTLYKPASTDPTAPAKAWHMKYTIPAGTSLQAGVNEFKFYCTELSGKSFVKVRARFADPSDASSIVVLPAGKDNSSTVADELIVYVINNTGASYTTLGDIELFIDIEDDVTWQQS